MFAKIRYLSVEPAAGLAKLGWELWSTEILENNESQDWLEGGDHGYSNTVWGSAHSSTSQSLQAAVNGGYLCVLLMSGVPACVCQERDMRAMLVAAGPRIKQAGRLDSTFYRNIHVYNLLAEMLNVKPAPNNGTWGALSSIMLKKR